MSAALANQAPALSAEKEIVEFVPFGAQEKIKLSISIVQNIIAVPTKSGKRPERNDCMKFMMLCRARHLNPFEGDAFLLGYDTQHGPQFSLITAHQVFLKRAEANEAFDGMESGVIVMTEDGIQERDGAFLMKGETLLGGWARVYRKDRTKHQYKRLNLAVFSTGRSRWEKDPAGMIIKCAEAAALRPSFPNHLGGLHIGEEQAPETEQERFSRAKPVMISSDANPFAGTTTAENTPRQRIPANEQTQIADGGEEKDASDGKYEDVFTKLRAQMEFAKLTEPEVVEFAIGAKFIEPCPYTSPLEKVLSPKMVERFLASWGELEEHVLGMRQRREPQPA